MFKKKTGLELRTQLTTTNSRNLEKHINKEQKECAYRYTKKMAVNEIFDAFFKKES